MNITSVGIDLAKNLFQVFCSIAPETPRIYRGGLSAEMFDQFLAAIMGARLAESGAPRRELLSRLDDQASRRDNSCSRQ
jgi:hypothetical protein